MKFKDLITTANGNIMQSKLRSILTIGAIFVGAFILTLSLGMSKGARDYIDFQLNGVEVPQTLIVEKNSIEVSDIFSQTPKKYEEGKLNVSDFAISLLDKNDRERIESKLEQFDYIQEIKPIYEVGIEYIELDGTRYIGNITTHYERMRSDMAAGSLDNLTENTIVVGYGYYRATGLKDPNELINSEVKVLAKNYNNEEKEFSLKVVGVMADSIALNLGTLVNLQTAENIKRFSTPDELNREEVSEYFIFLDEETTVEELEAVKNEIKALDYGVNTFDDIKKQFSSIISNIEAGLIIFSMLIIAVSIFGIVNTLLMSVYERTREIGLMKALGLKNRKIFQLFALESTIIGVWGSVTGVIMATSLGAVLNLLANNFLSDSYAAYSPYKIPFEQIPVIILGICIVSLISGTIPAIKAAKLDAIDALRHE